MRGIYQGHEETQVDLPGPLESAGHWSIGTWALPARILSLAAIFVFVVVAGFLLHDQRYRTLFVMPRLVAVAVAVVAAVLAWAVVLSCRSRPGRLLPRLVSLGLAAIASLLVVAGALDSDAGTPWLHALIVASFAAVVTTVPRVVRLRIDSPMVQRIAPLTLVFVLMLIIPSAAKLGMSIIENHEKSINDYIYQLQDWTEKVKESTSYDWEALQSSPDTAAAQVERLGSIEPGGLLADRELWQAAAVLERDAELAGASRELLDAVVKGLGPQRAPRLSILSEPVVRWDMGEKKWIPSTRFPRASEITGSYYHELGRIFLGLDQGQATTEIPSTIDLEKTVRERRNELEGYLKTTLETWADSWVIFQVPGHERWLDRDHLPLVDLLQRSLVEDGQRSLAPGDLRALLHLPLSQCIDLAAHAPGCDTASYEERMSDEAAYEFFRLDCYAYSPRPDSRGADLRVELRQVYKSQRSQSLQGSSLAAEVYFLFPIPNGEDEGPYLEEVMTSLANAVREYWKGTFMTQDRSGSVTAGFWFGERGDRVRVYQPRTIPLYDTRRAIQVRAVRFE